MLHNRRHILGIAALAFSAAALAAAASQVTAKLMQRHWLECR